MTTQSPDAVFDDLPQSWLDAVQRRDFRLLRFAPSLEIRFTRYYDSRFRGWLRGASLLIALFYSLRLFSLVVSPRALPDEELKFYFLMLGLAVGMAWTVFFLTYSRLRLELLQAITGIGVVAIAIAAGSMLQNGNATTLVVAITILLQILLAIPFGFRIRFWQSIPLFLIVTLLVFYFGTQIEIGMTVRLADQATTVLLFALTVGYMMEFDARQDFLNRALIYRLATTDDLSGVSNRRAFTEQSTAVIEAHLRTQRPLALLMLDIDLFKEINDRYGHLGGDEAIKRVAALCVEVGGQNALVGRLGGEEFGVLLPNCGRGPAYVIAEALKERVRSTVVQYEQQTWSVTVSIGVSTLGQNDLTIYTLLRRADQRLYEAKQNGRNRVVVEGRDSTAPLLLEK